MPLLPTVENQPQQTPPQQPVQQPAQQPVDDVDDGDNNPVFRAAMEFAYTALYEKNAGKGIAQSIQKARDKSDTIANIAYDITDVSIEKIEESGQSFPEDYIILFASNILTEVVEIAEAIGTDLPNEVVAGSFKIMLLRFLGEAGMDTTEIQTAMDAFTPDMINEAVSAVDAQGNGPVEERVA